MSELNIVHLSLKSLKAALCIAAKEDIRYYLNGVLVEAGALVTRVVATDGHMLFAHDYKHGSPQWEGKFIIPRDTLEMLTKPRATVDIVQVEIIKLATHKDAVHEVEEARFVFPAQIGFKPVQGVFPDYRRVAPRSLLQWRKHARQWVHCRAATLPSIKVGQMAAHSLIYLKELSV